MEEIKATEVKNWREKLGLSRKRLAEFAKVSMTTLRQLELGKHKPQQRTIKRITEALQKVASGKLPVESAAANSKPTEQKPAPAEGPIRLSNLDLELISRILNMTEAQKIDLLKQII